MKTYSEDEFKQKKLKSAHSNETVRYKSATDCIVKMYRNEGILSFYKGLSPSILKIFPASGLFFLFYELTLGALD